MAWNVSGELVEACSCNVMCPCWFGVKELMVMDQGWCDGTLLFRVNQGSSEGVDLSGRNVVVALDMPGPTMFDGNGTAWLYIDDEASADQQREFGKCVLRRQGRTHGDLGRAPHYITTDSDRRNPDPR